MPGTCEPEGYTAEKRKGHVRTLNGGASALFHTRIDYVAAKDTAAAVKEIESEQA